MVFNDYITNLSDDDGMSQLMDAMVYVSDKHFPTVDPWHSIPWDMWEAQICTTCRHRKSNHIAMGEWPKLRWQCKERLCECRTGDMGE